MDDNKGLHTHEMNTSDTSVPILVFGNGQPKVLDIVDEQDADGVALLVSKSCEEYSLDDENGLYSSKVNKPYFMIYFRNALFIDQMISILCDAKNRLIRKNQQ